METPSKLQAHFPTRTKKSRRAILASIKFSHLSLQCPWLAVSTVKSHTFRTTTLWIFRLVNGKRSTRWVLAISLQELVTTASRSKRKFTSLEVPMMTIARTTFLCTTSFTTIGRFCQIRAKCHFPDLVPKVSLTTTSFTSLVATRKKVVTFTKICSTMTL